MNRDDALLLGLGGAIALYLIYNRQGVGGVLESGAETVQAAVEGWASVNQGPVWVPVINIAEETFNLPTNLLARQAYQESRFRQEIIDGTQASPAGALGILQLMPAYFTSVQRPTPFSTTDTQDQINEAAKQMQGLFARFGDWGLALAAYNDGAGNVDQYLNGTRALPVETQNYVSQILTDVPLQSVLVA